LTNYGPNFSDRLKAAAKAKQDLLERAQANAPSNDPEFSERQEARKAAAILREKRAAERKAAKLADADSKIAEKAKEEEERAAALKAEQEREEAEAVEKAAREVALAAERKAARDARYAARKARQK